MKNTKWIRNYFKVIMVMFYNDFSGILFGGHCPCRNEGTCMDDSEGSGVYCLCPEGYYGIICQLGKNTE